MIKLPRFIWWMFVLTATLTQAKETVFDRNCIPCHKRLSASLNDMFKRYLLVYSGEKNVKAGIKHYLKHPHKDISVMGELFLERYGIKKPTHLSEEELNEAVSIYWERYKVFGKLK